VLSFKCKKNKIVMGIYIYKKDILNNNVKIIVSIILPFLITAILVALVYFQIIPKNFLSFKNPFLKFLFFSIRIELIPSIIIFLTLKNVSWWVKIVTIIIAYPIYWVAILFLYLFSSCALGLGCL
jgi:hypothetical protein